MIGVVLSGGESRRMGNDKGLIMAENKSWVQNAFDKLHVLFSQVVVSVNPAQYDLYMTQFENTQLVPDNNTISVNGPLHGLLSVHVQYPGDDLFVLACDMIAMDTIVLESLYKTYLEIPGKPCYVFSDDDGYQPLAGIYTNRLLNGLLVQSQSGQLKKFSMKHVLENAATYFIPVSEGWEQYFINCNFKEDINYQ